MARKLSLISMVLSLVGLIAVPTAAAAAGIQGHRVVATPVPTAERASAPTGGAMLAPAAVCPNQEDLDAPTAVQEQAMDCMVDFARRQAGLGELADSAALAQSARDKSLDILRCDNFSHFACGREFSYWMREAGYMAAPCWRIGENLAWGNGEYGSVRSIFTAWMRSAGHRANVLGDFDESGISLQAGTLAGQQDTRVWTEHFGSHCE